VWFQTEIIKQQTKVSFQKLFFFQNSFQYMSSADFLFFPEVISKQQEQEFLTKLLSETETKSEEWTLLKRRRLILAGACPAQQQDLNNTTVSQTPIHPWITGDLLEVVNKKLAGSSAFCERLGIQLPLQQNSDDNNKLNILINVSSSKWNFVSH
jgi:hypothetical protein